MRQAESEEESKALLWQRRAVQAMFVVINLVLIETRLPSVVWVVVGGIFWSAVIVITVTNGPIVCSWVCWLGAAQDWAEPLARRRVKLNANFWRAFTLAVAVLWAPVSWLIRPDTMHLITVPFGFNYTNLDAHLLQAAFFVMVGASVMLLGKRGACVHFCPLLLVARWARLKNWTRSFRLSKVFGKPVIINQQPARRV